MRCTKDKKFPMCHRCDLHKHRRHQVQGRGVLPCKLLVVGEAPGRSEDVSGEPFRGPSGRLLDIALADASQLVGVPVPNIYITNVVQCRPCSGVNTPNREPTEFEITKCQPNLERIVRLARPVRALLLGKIAAKYAGPMLPGAMRAYHPAYLLRRGGTACPEYREFVVNLSELLKEVHNESV